MNYDVALEVRGLENLPYRVRTAFDPFEPGETYAIEYQTGVMLWLNIDERPNRTGSYTVKLGFYQELYNITSKTSRLFTSAIKKNFLILLKSYKNNRKQYSKWVEYKILLKDVKDIYKLIETIDCFFLAATMSK